VARRTWRGDIAAGLRLVWLDRRLRAIALASAAMSICGGMADAAFVLFAIDEIGIGAGALGVVFTAGGAGFMAGAWLTRRWAATHSPTRVILRSAALMTAGQALLPFAPGEMLTATAVFAASYFVVGASSAPYSVNQISLRQRITPDHLLGRVNATMRFVTLGPTPLGALLGGLLASVIGLRATLALATLVLALSIPAAARLREETASER
jgi:MFS family permease